MTGMHEQTRPRIRHSASVEKPRIRSGKTYPITVRPIEQNAFVRVSNRYVQIAHFSRHSPKAIVALFYLAARAQRQFKQDPDAFEHRFTVDERALARVLSPQSKWVAKGNYKTIRSALEQLGSVPIPIEVVDVATERSKGGGIFPLDAFLEGPAPGLWEISFGKSFAKLLKIVHGESWGKNMLAELRSLRTTREINAYMLGCSLVGRDNPDARFVPYAVLRRFVGLTEPYYDNLRHVRRKFNALLKHINTVTGREFTVSEHNSEGVFLEDPSVKEVSNQRGDVPTQQRQRTAPASGRRGTKRSRKAPHRWDPWDQDEEDFAEQEMARAIRQSFGKTTEADVQDSSQRVAVPDDVRIEDQAHAGRPVRTKPRLDWKVRMALYREQKSNS